MFRDERELKTVLLPQGHQMPVVRCLVYLTPSPVGRVSGDCQEELPERKLRLATANINVNTRITCTCASHCISFCIWSTSTTQIHIRSTMECIEVYIGSRSMFLVS